MNEEYLQRLYDHLGVSEDFNSFVNKLQTDESYSQKVHGDLGITTGYDDWYKHSFGDKKKESTESQSTGVQEVTPSDSGVAESSNVETSNGVSTEVIFNLNDFNADLYNASESLYNLDGTASPKWDIDHGLSREEFQKSTTDFLNKYGISNLDDFRKVLNAEIGNQYSDVGVYDEVFLEGHLSAVQELIDYNNKAQENAATAEMASSLGIPGASLDLYSQYGITPPTFEGLYKEEPNFFELREERFLPITEARTVSTVEEDKTVVLQEENTIYQRYQAERRKLELIGDEGYDVYNHGNYRNGLYYPTIDEQKQYKLVEERYGEQIAMEQFKWAKDVSEHRRRNFFHSYTEREIIQKNTELLNKVSDGELAIVTNDYGDLQEVWNSDWALNYGLAQPFRFGADMRDVYHLAQAYREDALNREESWSRDAYMQDPSVPESDKTGDNPYANYPAWKAKKIDEANLERAAVYYENDEYYNRAMRDWGFWLNRRGEMVFGRGTESIYERRMDEMIEKTSSYRETALALTEYFSYADRNELEIDAEASEPGLMMRGMSIRQEDVVNAAKGVGLLPADFELATLSEDEKAELMQSLRDKVSYIRGSLESQMMELNVATNMYEMEKEQQRYHNAKAKWESGRYEDMWTAMESAGYKMDMGGAMDFIQDTYSLAFDMGGPIRLPYTRSWTSDFIMNKSNDIGIFFADALGSPEYAEKWQQDKQSRNIRTQLELGLDPYDNRTATEMFQDGDSDLAWTKIFLQVSQTMPYLVVGGAAPGALPAMAGGTAFFETYENYRDRGDLTEGQKISLAISASAIEGTITWIGMGNLRATRASLGIADDIGTQTIAARRAAYERAVNYLAPQGSRVRDVLLSPTARGLGMGTMNVAAEEIEELSIAAGVMGSARVIAGDEFRPEVLGDVALTTGIASGPVMGVTNTVTEYNNARMHQRLSEAALGVDLQEFMNLSDLRQDIKDAINEIGLDASPREQSQKQVLQEELQKVTQELSQIKARAQERIQYYSDEDKASLDQINRAILDNVDTYNSSDQATVRSAAESQIKALLDAKNGIESKYNGRYIFNGEEMTKEDFIQAVRQYAESDPAERGDVDIKVENDNNTGNMVEALFGVADYIKSKPKTAVEEEEIIAEESLPAITPEQRSESALTQELNTDDIGISPADGKSKSLQLDEELSYGESGSVGKYVNAETGNVEAIVALPDRKTDASYVVAEKTGENEYSLNVDVSEDANIDATIGAINSALPQGSTLKIAPGESVSTDGITAWSNKIQEGYTPTEETVSVPVNGKGETDLGGRPSDANNPDSPLEFDTEEDAMAAAKIVEESVADIPGATVWTKTESLGRGKERHTVEVTLPKLESGEKAAAPETSPTVTETESIFSPEAKEADGQKQMEPVVNENGETIVETKQERRDRRNKKINEIAQDISEEESQQLLEEAEEETAKEKKEIEERSKKPSIFSRWYERLVFRDARLKSAVKKGLGDYAASLVERRYNAAGYVSKEMQTYIKEVFGQDVKVFGRGITNIQVTQGKAEAIDRVIHLRRIIEIDEKFDSRKREAEQKLSELEAEYKELVASYEAATGDTKKEIAKQIKDSGIKKEIKDLSKAIEDGEYNRPLHPSDMTSEKAMRELAALQNTLGIDEYNDINSRADNYFTAMEDVLRQAKEYGLIDAETYERFVKEDYSPRMFLSKIFGDVDDSAFNGFRFADPRNKKEFIQSLRDGSNESVLTDSAQLLELTLRAVKTRGHQNKILSTMHNLAKDKNYEGVDFMAEANVDQDGNVLEADKGFFNVDYFVDGKKQTFQVRVDLASQLMGQYESIFTPQQRKRISQFMGTSTMKTLATGTNTAFALTAAMRYPFEVVYGRGIYDKYAFTPVMVGFATFDLSLGLKDAVLNTAIVEEYAKAGGLTDLLTAQGTPAKRTQQKRRGPLSRITGKITEGAWHTVAWAGNKSELAARIAIYKRAKSNLKRKYPDMSEEEIQSIAVEESLMLANFSASGTIGRDIESFTPYFNAGLQGTRGWVEYAKENPKMFTAKITQSFATAFSLNYLLMGQLSREEYEAISDHEKKMYYMIYMGRDDQGRPEIFKIPKAHVVLGVESAAIKTSEYTKAMEEGSEYVWEEDEDWMGFVADGFSTSIIPSMPVYIDDISGDPRFGSDIPFLKMMIAYNYNQDMFRNDKIYKGEEDIYEYMKGQRDDDTEDFMKALSLEFAGTSFEFSPQKGQRALEQVIIGERNFLVDKLYDAANWAANYGDHFNELQEEYGIIPEEQIVEQNFRNGIITEEEYNKRMEEIIEINDDLSTLVGAKGRIKVIDLEKAYRPDEASEEMRTEQNTRTRLFKNYVLDLMEDVELTQDAYNNYILPNPVIEDILAYGKEYGYDEYLDDGEMMRYALYLGRGETFLGKDVEPILFSKSRQEAVSRIEFLMGTNINNVSIPEMNEILYELQNAGMSKSRAGEIMIEYNKRTGVTQVPQEAEEVE